MDGFPDIAQTPRTAEERGARSEALPARGRSSRSRDIIDFQLELGRHGALLGREDVLAELNAFLGDGQSCGWVLVKGGPGMGKSALLAAWLKQLEAAGLPMPPHHFLRRGVEDWDRPEVVKRNLAAQVEALYPEQANPEARPESRLREVLQQVSREVLVPRRERLVLVVDGLDEAEVGPDGANPLPGFLPHVLPLGVKVLCASRPTYPYLDWLEARECIHTVDLDGEQWAASNGNGVRQYWEHRASRFEPPLTPAFVDEVVQRAEGNMLYAVKLAEWLREQPVEGRRAELLPRGLEALLEESWEHIQELPGELRKVVLAGLGVVAVAREALPLPILAAVAEWKGEEDGGHFLRVARPFLLEEAGRTSRERAWRPFHESFRSFILLKLEERREAAEQEQHRRLAKELCQWPVDASGRGFRRNYVLRHGVMHWLKAGDWEQARGLYTDLGYLEAKCQLADVPAVEGDLRNAAEGGGGNEPECPRALLRIIQTGSHWLRKDPKALAQLVYNGLRSSDWKAERIEQTLRFPEGLPALRLRHPVKTGGSARTLQGHSGGVAGCAVTPDGRRVVSAGGDSTLKVWELDTGRELATLQGHASWVAGCAVTPDGRRVVSASDDKTLKVWELDTGKELATLRGHLAEVTGCAVTPDGRRLVSVSADSTLKVWELDTGRELDTVWGHMLGVTGCAVTPDGRRAVSSSWDKTLKVWELDTAQGRVALEGHSAGVTGCAVTPDGQRVVSASSDKTLKVWDIDSGQCLHTLYGVGDFRSVAATSELICAGDSLGNVWILEACASVSKPRPTPPAMPPPESTVSVRFPRPVLEAYRAGTLALFIGSGLSLAHDVRGHFPTWSQLPHRLLEACERLDALDAQTLEAKRILFKARLRLEVMLAELGSLRTALGRDYQKALNDIFRPADAAPGTVHQAVGRLGVPAILTTNYDSLLEEVGETPRRQAYTWKESDLALNDLLSGRHVLLKIHGTAERHDTVVMTEGEYREVRSSPTYRAVLDHLLQRYTALFIGYGLNDPLDLDLVLEWNAEAFKAAARRYYALLKDPGDTDRDRYEREYNVRVIPYRDHAELPAILEELPRAATRLGTH